MSDLTERLKRAQKRWEKLSDKERACHDAELERVRDTLRKSVSRIEAEEKELTSGSTDLYAVALEVCEETNSDMLELLELDADEFDKIVRAILRKRKRRFTEDDFLNDLRQLVANQPGTGYSIGKEFFDSLTPAERQRYVLVRSKRTGKGIADLRRHFQEQAGKIRKSLD